MKSTLSQPYHLVHSQYVYIKQKEETVLEIVASNQVGSIILIEILNKSSVTRNCQHLAPKL